MAVSCKGCYRELLSKNHPDCVNCDVRTNYNRIASDYTILGDVKPMPEPDDLKHPDLTPEKEIDALIEVICMEHGVEKEDLTKVSNNKSYKDRSRLRPVRIKLAAALSARKLKTRQISDLIGVPLGSLWTYTHPEKYEAFKNKTGRKSKKNPAEKTKNTETRKEEPMAENDHILTIDFSAHKDILDKIKKTSQDLMREPEKQVLYWLVNADFEELERKTL